MRSWGILRMAGIQYTADAAQPIVRAYPRAYSGVWLPRGPVEAPPGHRPSPVFGHATARAVALRGDFRRRVHDLNAGGIAPEWAFCGQAIRSPAHLSFGSRPSLPPTGQINAGGRLRSGTPSWHVHPRRFRLRTRHPSERNPAYVCDQLSAGSCDRAHPSRCPEPPRTPNHDGHPNPTQ